MILQLLFSIVTGFGVAAAIAAVVWVRKSIRATGNQSLDLAMERVFDLSIERYAPMFRLTEEADFHFLAAQPGFQPEMARRLREQRYRMFLAYLRSLHADFDGVAVALKHVLANADHDRANLASTLLHAQAKFGWAFVLASVRVWAWRKGLASVDTRHVLALFDAVQIELRVAAPRLTAA